MRARRSKMALSIREEAAGIGDAGEGARDRWVSLAPSFYAASKSFNVHTVFVIPASIAGVQRIEE